MPTMSPDQWQALSPYLDEALGMTDEERSIWLSSLRAQNPGLVEQLEVLLMSTAHYLKKVSSRSVPLDCQKCRVWRATL